ncbi:MAG: RNA polymerase sigma factor [Streptosporangiaceae bacterium]|jgi:RNA polymerase sigma-70 factor (ECF subfamily)
MDSNDTRTAISAAFRQEWGRVVAALISMTGDWDLAEECAQEAFARALRTWPRDGIPDRPGGWLVTTARNRAVDVLRRRANESAKLREVALLSSSAAPMDDSGITDDRLRLIFTCCHPALALDARVALTLRTLAGLTTAEIARAFLVSEQTMAKRLVRAKGRIRGAGIPYRVPPAHLLAERTTGVLAVLYLLFNEGYGATAGQDLLRPDLCGEAIRLSRIVCELMPGEAEASGLLALMLLHDSRRDARTDAAGELVPLEDQDRARWDQAKITEGRSLLAAGPASGQYQIQAAIAACHVSAATPSDTDWRQIARLYGELAEVAPSPVVELNRAVAIGMANGPVAGIELVDTLTASGQLAGYHLLPATRADLLRRLGRHNEAADYYREALDLTRTDAERRFLSKRLAEVTRT